MSENLCKECLQPLSDDAALCPTCGLLVGRENPPMYLPVGTLLSERYGVGAVVEAGGDSALYQGYDRITKSAVLIREFFPTTLCERNQNGDMTVLGGCEATYADYLDKFRKQVRALARMRELPAIIPIYDIFEEHKTAYAVSEPEEGVSLEQRLQEIGGHMRWADARPLFMPLMSSLVSLHAAGICHFGLTPDNLLIGSDGKLRVRGFHLPEARFAATDLAPMLADGYAAPEQYAFGASVSATADVYGLMATLFRTLTGMAPPVASGRSPLSNDLFLSADVARELPDQVAAALFNGLQVEPENRIPSLKDLEYQLATAPALAALLDEEEDEPVTAPVPAPAASPATEKKSAAPLIIIGAVSLLLVILSIVAVVWIFSSGDDTEPDPYTPPTQSDTVPTDPLPEGETFAVPPLEGENFYEVRNGEFYGDMSVELEYLQYSSKKAGTILSQTPAADEQVAAGTVIKVVISAGPEELKLPDLTDWEYKKARLYLEALGLTVDYVEITGSEYKRGRVDHCDPESGNPLKRGDKVTLFISGQDPTERPTEITEPEVTEQTYPDWTEEPTTTAMATPTTTTQAEEPTTTVGGNVTDPTAQG